MTQKGRSISLSEEVVTVVTFLASSKKQSFSRYLENKLREDKIIKEMLHRFEQIPDLPPMVKGNIPYSTIEED